MATSPHTSTLPLPAADPGPRMPHLSERTAYDLLCELEDQRALLDHPCRHTACRAVVRAMLLRHVLWVRGVDTPDLHPMEERAAFGHLPEHYGDVHEPASLVALSVIVAHGGFVVEA